MIVTVLGLGYLRRYQELHAFVDIEIALSNLWRVVELSPNDHPDMAPIAVLPFRLVSTSSTTSQTLMQLLMIVELP
jgi:hypothetical protein